MRRRLTRNMGHQRSALATILRQLGLGSNVGAPTTSLVTIASQQDRGPGVNRLENGGRTASKLSQSPFSTSKHTPSDSRTIA
jgi:hypothetical protein